MNEKEKLIRKIQESAFVAHECALYLDNHPKNKLALARHKKASEALFEYRAEYEKLYGSLSEYTAEDLNRWNWASGSWPWQI